MGSVEQHWQGVVGQEGDADEGQVVLDIIWWSLLEEGSNAQFHVVLSAPSDHVSCQLNVLQALTLVEMDVSLCRKDEESVEVEKFSNISVLDHIEHNSG